MLKGIAASAGVSVAKAYKLEAPVVVIEKKDGVPAEEIEKFNNALEKTIKDIEGVKERAAKRLSEEELAVFDAHLMMAQDPEFASQIKSMIENDKVNAEYAADTIASQMIAMFEAMDNDYFRERAADIKDVTFRLKCNLLGLQIPDLTAIDEPTVIVAHDLTPSDTAQLNEWVKGFATAIGGKTSHSAIMANSLEIPAVVGCSGVLEAVKTGDVIGLDALDGYVYVNPDEDKVKELEAKAKAYAEEKEALKVLVSAKSITTDGHEVELAGNIGGFKDVEGVLKNGGEGVGLFRTEFLYMDNDHFPTEEEQFEAYKQVLEGMDGKKVVVRTLDIGGDKKLSYYTFPEEMNPFLGYRAIRLCLKEQDIFRTQLRALCRASVYGKLCIMFPMIATINEFRQAKAIYEDVKAELISEGVQVADDIQVGMMVEIPAAAVLADEFSKYADFFSIGTNDLIQYSMAADRMSENVSYLYQPYNPSILRLINMTIQGAHKNGRWVGMCGAMAGEPYAVPILLGLGLDEFSMSATQILKARKVVTSLSFEEMKKLAAECLNKDTAEEVLDYVKSVVD
ncbi:phosphoenolpyruvate--protein phosphotransferase [uncultured Dubosiella sp.]|jgi:phosphotransferase system enzyme I (PtsI)|uniref:phosphoenolpyruvate--protein phosphotransferase n=1 Tax=uncultured Dubosiella sp. TaxID=1937011 RepID=UPI002089AED6|nr:phosphoenolpyruvate--protein phosphotransferase [uncultured Dubosiella sp.]GJM57417.1 phosphoenolpyruvate-protein phosphotransferase [Erysipelotrichaceae bacterium OPF54]